PEMVKAYRDTWTLGIHSYLNYLRDRLIVARELLADSGSIFIQIGDENVHLVRNLLDEVFGSRNFVGSITVQKTTSATNNYLPLVADHLLWFSRDITCLKYKSVYKAKTTGEDDFGRYNYVSLPDGEKRAISSDSENILSFPQGSQFFAPDG